MKKLMGILLAAMLAATTMAGCGSKPGESSATPAPAQPEATSQSQTETVTPEAQPQGETFTPATVRVAYMPNMGSASLLSVAQEQGFFEEMGLTVDTTQFQGGPAEIAAMASGDIDISQIGHGAHALAIEGQALVFELDNTSLADAVLGNTDKGVNSIEDLRGKTVATTAGTSAEIILNLALQSAGMTQADMEIVEMDVNGIVSAMVSGSVDACATWSPSTGTIREQLGEKCITLADNATYADQVTFPSSFITTQKYVDGNRDILVRFARALQKAMDYRAANTEQTTQYVAKMIEVDEAIMLDKKDEGNWLTSEFIGSGLADGSVAKVYENQQKVFIDSGRVTAGVDVKEYVLFDIMQDAHDANQK